MANKLLKSLNFGGNDTYTVAHEWKHLGESETVIIDNQTIAISDGMGDLSVTIKPNCKYKVIYNGTEYQMTSQTFSEGGENTYYLGNGTLGGIEGGEEHPFCIATRDMSATNGMVVTFILPQDASLTEVTLTLTEVNIKPIDTKYLPKHLQFGEKEVELLNGTYEFALNEDMGMYMVMVPTDLTLNNGDTLDVVWDGSQYANVSVSIIEGNPMFGNGMIMGMGDTGEPFFGMISEGLLILCDFITSETVTRNVQIRANITTKLSKKYTPSSTLLFIYEENGVKYLTLKENGTKMSNDELVKIVNAQEEIYIFHSNGVYAKPLVISTSGHYGIIVYNSLQTVGSSGNYTYNTIQQIAFTSEYTG